MHAFMYASMYGCKHVRMYVHAYERNVNEWISDRMKAGMKK